MTNPNPNTAGPAAPVLIEGDAAEFLRALDPATVDLVFTSPPYADRRADTYGGPPPDAYVEWFIPFASEIRRVLKPTGTFALNIKEGTRDGQRLTYVHDLVAAMRETGWRWTDEHIWRKTSGFAGHWPDRTKDMFERVHLFNLEPRFAFYPRQCETPAKESTLRRYARRDITTGHSNATGSGFSWGSRRHPFITTTLPSNVVELALSTRNYGHSAAFPVSLPAHFIRLFTRPGDLVVDPFAGSGATLVAANELARRAAGSEIVPEHCSAAARRLAVSRFGGGRVDGSGAAPPADDPDDPQRPLL